MSGVNLERALAIAQESDSMSGVAIEALVDEIKELRKEKEMTKEEYTTYYFTHTRNGRTNEVNDVHRVEFKRHFVLFYDAKGILIVAERQEHIAELRQELAA